MTIVFVRLVCFPIGISREENTVGAGCLVARSCMMCAYGRVCGNDGSGMVDDMTPQLCIVQYLYFRFMFY